MTRVVEAVLLGVQTTVDSAQTFEWCDVMANDRYNALYSSESVHSYTRTIISLSIATGSIFLAEFEEERVVRDLRLRTLYF